MNVGDFFAAAAALPSATIEEIAGGCGLVVIAPHPDDESLGCGALIAAGCAAGMRIRVLVLSDGVGSHPNSRQYPPSRLRDLREAETRQAAAELGLAADAVRFLRLPDRFVPVAGLQAEMAHNEIRAAVSECRAAAVFVTWDRDPHCDHVAAARLVRDALARENVRIFHYPVWGWTLPGSTDVGPAPRGVRFNVGPHASAKQAAIAAHRSQTTELINDDPDGFRLQPEMLANFAKPFEIFLEIERTGPS